MRDILAILVIVALIVGGYFGYKAFFGEETTSAEAAVTPPVEPEVTQPPGLPAPQPVAELAEQTVPEQPKGERSPVVQDDPAQKLFEQTRSLCGQGKIQDAAICVNTLMAQYQDSPFSAPAATVLAAALISTDKWTARNLYSFAFDHTSDSALKEECLKNLDQLNNELVFSPTQSKDGEFYQIQPGDVLTTIAAKFNCPYRFIMQINKIDDARNLRAGDRIKVISGPKGKMEMKIVVDKSDFTLIVYLNGYFLKQYKVGLGKFDKTPTGTFVVTERLEKPTWRGYKYGDPKNILGDYWLTLANDKFSGIGIHGTNDPTSIGKNASDGCVRMRNEDVKELYIMVPKGTEVVIKE